MMNYESLTLDYEHINKKQQRRQRRCKALLILGIIFIVLLGQCLIWFILILKGKDQLVINSEKKAENSEIAYKSLIVDFEIPNRLKQIVHVKENIKNALPLVEANESKLNTLKEKNKELTKEIDSYRKYAELPKDFSTILSQKHYMLLENMTKCTFNKLCYRGIESLFSPEEFHAHCDNVGPTVVIIKTNDNQYFGGFTRANWDGNGLKYDNKSFLYSLSFQKKLTNSKSTPAINALPDKMPIFGEDDLVISSKSYLKSYLKSFPSENNDSSDSNIKFFFSVNQLEIFQMICNDD